MQHISSLLTLMATLRDPDKGCPWDKEQDFSSIAPYTIEEAYEVAEAIAQEDYTSLREELGDLLLQVVFLSQIASEQGLFHFEDVANAINDKLIRRHPHIFSEQQIANYDTVTQTIAWEKSKAEERTQKAHSAGKTASILDDVPLALPSLLRASKLQKRASTVGFDWPNIEGIWDKLAEEIAELKHEIATGTPASQEAELGDILFVLAHLANRLKANPETALRQTNQKFERRFRYIEEQLTAQGKTCDDVGLATMDALWDEAKARGL